MLENQKRSNRLRLDTDATLEPRQLMSSASTGAVIVGSSGSDQLIGTSGDDVIFAEPNSMAETAASPQQSFGRFIQGTDGDDLLIADQIDAPSPTSPITPTSIAADTAVADFLNGRGGAGLP